MDAFVNVPVVTDVKRLARRQMKMIVNIATRPSDEYWKRAERLKLLKFCTDDVKFDVLKASDRISDDLYEIIHTLYFGLPSTTEQKEPIPEQEEQPEKREQKQVPRKHLSDEETVSLINMYLDGMSYEDIAVRFVRTVDQIKVKIRDEKRKGKHKAMFNIEESEKFNEIIESVDAGNRKEPETKDEDAPEPFCAEGTGLISTDGSIKLDDELILAALRKEMIDSGCVQCYGTVQIVITPHKPTGMKVTRGCRE